MKTVPLHRSSLRKPVHWLAVGLGAGLSPKAPGTVGTLVAVPLYLLLAPLSLPLYLVALVLSFALGVYLCAQTAEDLGVHDHPGIVWDEWVGYWITMAAAPSGWGWVVLGFALFRLLDVWKPWPVRWFDRNVHGGLGIMMDDVVAGVMAWACVQLCAMWL